jgi:hypothetical protein
VHHLNQVSFQSAKPARAAANGTDLDIGVVGVGVLNSQWTLAAKRKKTFLLRGVFSRAVWCSRFQSAMVITQMKGMRVLQTAVFTGFPRLQVFEPKVRIAPSGLSIGPGILAQPHRVLTPLSHHSHCFR